MSVELVPSVLARTKNQFQRRLKIATALHDRVHIDVMDGKFVPTKSISAATLATLSLPPNLTFHLMVTEPFDWLALLQHCRARTVVLHVELGPRLRPTIQAVRRLGLRVVLAANPGTPLTRFQPHLRFANGLQLMMVWPGRYRARWLSTSISRITWLRRHYPQLKLIVDGGVHRETLPRLVAADIQQAVVGSAIMFSRSPRQAWVELNRLTKMVKK